MVPQTWKILPKILQANHKHPKAGVCSREEYTRWQQVRTFQVTPGYCLRRSILGHQSTSIYGPQKGCTVWVTLWYACERPTQNYAQWAIISEHCFVLWLWCQQSMADINSAIYHHTKLLQTLSRCDKQPNCPQINPGRRSTFSKSSNIYLLIEKNLERHLSKANEKRIIVMVVGHFSAHAHP